MWVGLKKNVGVAIRWIMLGVVGAILSGCANNSISPAPVSAASSSYSYIIGPGDTVNIAVRLRIGMRQSIEIIP
ncbi:hypothetical protein AGMMS50256_38450 [Betaproteobacteria bacterium]|nr:hypothetical protein AGMMS50256_38450 [Betaproteobacteria bacterium]